MQGFKINSLKKHENIKSDRPSFSLFNIYKIKGGWLAVLLVFIITLPVFSQSSSKVEKTKTNLNIFYLLVDSAVNDANSNIPVADKNIKLEFPSGSSYSLFGNQFIKDFSKLGKNIISASDNNSSAVQINFVVDHAKVTYDKLFRKVLFGDYYARREISFGGNYSIMQPKAVVKNFSFSFIDTVDANEIKNIEDTAIPFTQAALPAEPFFSSIYEPVIAVGAAALTVILFFTVRSK